MEIYLSEKAKKLFDDPTTIDRICAHVAGGGSIVDWCITEGIAWAALHVWINKKPQQKQYLAAEKAQTEWAIKKVLAELRDLAFIDVSKTMNDDGSIKPLKDWPKDALKAVAGIDVTEKLTGETKTRVTMVSKIKSIELMMKNLSLLTDRAMVLTGDSDDQDFRNEFFGIK